MGMGVGTDMSVARLVKISDEKDVWVNPEFVNAVTSWSNNNNASLGSEVSLCYTRILTELPVKEVIKRLNP